jgi:hypothetical protein
MSPGHDSRAYTHMHTGILSTGILSPENSPENRVPEGASRPGNPETSITVSTGPVVTLPGITVPGSTDARLQNAAGTDGEAQSTHARNGQGLDDPASGQRAATAAAEACVHHHTDVSQGSAAAAAIGQSDCEGAALGSSATSVQDSGAAIVPLEAPARSIDSIEHCHGPGVVQDSRPSVKQTGQDSRQDKQPAGEDDASACGTSVANQPTKPAAESVPVLSLDLREYTMVKHVHSDTQLPHAQTDSGTGSGVLIKVSANDKHGMPSAVGASQQRSEYTKVANVFGESIIDARRRRDSDTGPHAHADNSLDLYESVSVSPGRSVLISQAPGSGGHADESWHDTRGLYDSGSNALLQSVRDGQHVDGATAAMHTDSFSAWKPRGDACTEVTNSEIGAPSRQCLFEARVSQQERLNDGNSHDEYLYSSSLSGSDNKLALYESGSSIPLHGSARDISTDVSFNLNSLGSSPQATPSKPAPVIGQQTYDSGVVVQTLTHADSAQVFDRATSGERMAAVNETDTDARRAADSLHRLRHVPDGVSAGGSLRGGVGASAVGLQPGSASSSTGSMSFSSTQAEALTTELQADARDPSNVSSDARAGQGEYQCERQTDRHDATRTSKGQDVSLAHAWPQAGSMYTRAAGSAHTQSDSRRDLDVRGNVHAHAHNNNNSNKEAHRSAHRSSPSIVIVVVSCGQQQDYYAAT